jgi:hypothetical protein
MEGLFPVVVVVSNPPEVCTILWCTRPALAKGNRV